MNIDLEKIENRKEKEELAFRILDKVKDGDCIGFGSGTYIIYCCYKNRRND